MTTRFRPGSSTQPELARLRELVAEQHRRLRVVRGEAPASPMVLSSPPSTESCGTPRLATAAMVRLLEEVRHRVELLDTAVGTAIWAAWPERRPTVPVLRPTPGLSAYALRNVEDLPNVALALFFRRPEEIEAAIGRVLAEQQSGDPFIPIFLTNHADFTSLREQRLAFEYFPFRLDESAPAPEPAWAAYLIATLELTLRRWGVRQIVNL
ncbi:MAG: hypothetical protein ACJ8H8_10985 [Geminicoccaceae bacterium]